MIYPSIFVALFVGFLAVSLLIRWKHFKDKQRKRQLDEYLEIARKHFNQNKIPQALVQNYDQMRVTLYKQTTQRPLEQLPLDDQAIQQSQNFSESWQRKLPSQQREMFCAALLRRLVATIPAYEAAQRNLNKKFVLYSKNLLADSQIQHIVAEFQDICNQLQMIIFDATCIEQGDGNGPTKLLKTAHALIQLQARKEAQAGNEKKSS